MFLASKYEDIYPLKMQTVFEKIGHEKLEIETIKKLELDIIKVIKYRIHAPTVLDFLKQYLLSILGIQIQSRTETRIKETAILKSNGVETTTTEPDDKIESFEVTSKIVEDFLIEKMAIYLGKMSMHDLEISSEKPSLVAVGSIYVALKICE